MVKMATSNKRKNIRINCAVPVEGKAGSVFDKTATVDVSKGGLGFISRHHIPLNKEIAIELDLFGETDPVLVIGRVRWVRHVAKSVYYRVGLAFEDVLKGSKSRLERYFASK